MDFEDLQAAWRSPANTPDDKAKAYLMEEVMKTLRARRRAELLFFLIPTTAMAIFTVILARSILSGQTDMGREWGGVVMMGVCWAVLAAMLVAAVVARRRGGPHASAVRESLELMLASNRAARAHVRIFWIMLPVFIVPMLVGVAQLREVGKATERDSWQMLFVFGVALVASVGWNTSRYLWVMKPEQRRLETLLEAYED